MSAAPEGRSPDAPEGLRDDAQEFFVFWCPECKVQRPYSFHDFGGMGDRPAGRHECERIEVVPKARLVADLDAAERARDEWIEECARLNGQVYDWRRIAEGLGYEGPWPDGRPA